ncbi:hypothetical protein GCM10025859_10980 [Alicyclobacillus fastidiosus]|nr:hypothetical protein GCM10025859_10980 [Alicyclobacillus fastidiosus]
MAEYRHTHIYIRNENGKVIFYSPDPEWNGHIMNIYYVPRDDLGRTRSRTTQGVLRDGANGCQPDDD